MKRLTALLAAALISLSFSVPAFAEPDETAEAEESSVSAENSTGQDSTGQNSAGQNSAGQNSAGQNSAGQNNAAQESGEKTESEENKPVRMMEFRINEADMNISIPSDMYVITRDTDENDPVLALNRTNKEQYMKEFEENDIYLRASAKDFSWVVSVMETANDDTETIGSLSSLSEKNLQQIIDKLLASDIYTGCSKNRFGGVLFLTFTIEYKNGETNVSGIQQYTIINGKNVRITYQTAAPADKDPNKSRLNDIMETVRFDGIEIEPSREDVSHSLSVSDIDIRYIYIIAASLIGVIALMIMIITGIKYKKSKKNAAKKKSRPKAEKTAPKKTEKQKNEEEPHKPVSVKDLEAFSDSSMDDKDFVPSVMSYKDIIAEENGFDENEANPMTYNDISNASFVNNLEDTGIIELPDIENGNDGKKDVILIKNAKDMQDEKDENGEDIVFARTSAKRRTEIEQVSDENKTSQPEAADGKLLNTNKPETSTVTENASKNSETDKTEPSQKTSHAAEKAEEVMEMETAFFSRMFDTIKTADSGTSKTETTGGSTQLLPDDDKETKKDMTGNSIDTWTNEDSMNGKKKGDTIELEISKSADGSLVIGALNEQNGKPVDIEIRDASNFKEERDRLMAKLGLATVRDNEIYNAFKAENEEKPFVVRAQDENEIAEAEKKKEEKRLTPETEEEFFEGVKETVSAPENSEEIAENDAVLSEFERESGIVFERPTEKKGQIIPMQTVFTKIPRLDSVNAEEYNAKYVEMIKAMPKNRAYAQRFSNSNIPQPFVETAKPHHAEAVKEKPVEEPPVPETPAEPQNDSIIEFYTGYEQNDDPFSAPADKEILIKEHNKKKSGGSFGSKLRKFFSSEAQAPEDED